ncbi:uncharacterized protein LOC134814250 [Bolinopsis microptera]|uniref:uncharacterized protein LOC134814250 n=1 Tax=Bolinopsis microptera TaxID=2820187 RepID=UPI0030791F37
MSRSLLLITLCLILLMLVNPGLTKKNKKRRNKNRYDNLTTCSGHQLRGMTCECLASNYNMRGCPDDLKKGSKQCIHYETYCKSSKLSAAKQGKMCCQAILCNINLKNC